MLRGQKLLGFERVVARSGEFQVRDFLDVAFQLVQGQRLIVYGDTFKHGG